MSDESPWIERVVKVAAALGMNPTRLRWKLIRWQENRRREQRRREQQVEHVRYEHKTCDHCGTVQDRDAKLCSKCGAKLGSRGVQVLKRLGLAMPEALSLSTVLALAIMAVHMRVLVAQGGGIGSPSGSLLLDFGAQWELGAPDPWRLLTAMFLHIGLWHLGFNLIALATIGPQIEAIYGRLTMLFIFVATGVLANVGSGLVQPEVLSAGASGGMCGLIGAAAGYGHRLGTTGGRMIRNDMLKWLLYTIVFGFVIGANNWAHAFGALSGAALGYAVQPTTWARPALLPVRAIAKTAGLAATVAAIVIIFTRTPSDHTQPETDFVTVEYGFFRRTCRLFYDGHRDAAAALLASHYTIYGGAPGVNESTVAGTCGALLEMRDQCKSQRFGADECAPIERAFGDFPEHPEPR